jgi:hypothetical protein
MKRPESRLLSVRHGAARSGRWHGGVGRGRHGGAEKETATAERMRAGGKIGQPASVGSIVCQD